MPQDSFRKITVHSNSSDHIFTQMLLLKSKPKSQIPRSVRKLAYSNFEDQFLAAILCLQSIENRRKRVGVEFHYLRERGIS